MNISVATSGFSYNDWVGPVYPAGTRKEDMLAYYSHELGFKMVELNYTYYHLPKAKSVEGMLADVSEDFRFVLKAHKSLTQNIRGSDGSYIRDEGSITTFREGIAPLLDAKRLVSVLAQFPIKFRKEPGAIEHLKWLAGALAPIKLTVELRNADWLTASMFELLRSIDASYCVVDEPDLPQLMRFIPEATSSIGYFRLHGRNKNWFNTPSHVRYDYLYNDIELRGFLEPIKKLGALTKETMVFFNNHPSGSAVKNALTLQQLLNQDN